MADQMSRILEKYPSARRQDLIPILQDVQETLGYLSKEAVTAVAQHLKLPATKIFGVATFYNQFRFHPRGKYHFTVCRGTACHVKGSLKSLELLTKTLKLEPGKTSKDRLFSIEVVACMGACGLAPVVNINGEFHAKMTPAKLAKLVDDIRKKEKGA